MSKWFKVDSSSFFFLYIYFFLYPLENSFNSQVLKNLPAMQETQEMWV